MLARKGPNHFCLLSVQCLDELMKDNKVRGFAKVIVSNEINSGLSFL